MGVSEARQALWRDPEYRARQTESRKARWRNPEYREHMRAERRTRRHREDTKERIRLIQLEKWQDPEYRQSHAVMRKRPDGMTPYEHAAKAIYENEGWTVVRNGWPDFILTKPDGATRFIEVKGPNDELRPEQTRVHEILRRLGASVDVIEMERGSAVFPKTDGDNVEVM